MKTDSQVQQSVLDELAWDTRVCETEVGVAVDRGVVTLTGTVNSWSKRRAAQEAAHRVAGVLDVVNDLEVRLAGSLERTDTQIAQAVRDALEWNELVPDDRIRTTVTRGRVTLEGEVETWAEREDTERAVRDLSGVTAVKNKIAVRPPAVRADEIREAIEEALERQAEREAQKIKVKVLGDGQVTLSGTVHSLVEKRAVVGAAQGTRGVRAVEADLHVRPYA